MQALKLSADEARWLELARDPQADAERVELVYVSDEGPGLRRRRCGRGFMYLDTGRRSLDGAQRERCRHLAIPPAWREVWICPDPRGHIQATGRDERGRKQYIYHPQWERVRAETKFNRMLPFGRALPLLRERAQQAMQRRTLGPERVVAAVVALLDRTFIRVGNEEYATQNATYGLTTLREHHVELYGRGQFALAFRGKSGVERSVEVVDRRLARVLRDCHELPGQRLFKYRDASGAVRPVTSSEVNDWLREVTGLPFSAKDFRTWAGCVVAGAALAALEPPRSAREARLQVCAALDQVAARLGNTRTVCRKYYVHPQLIDAFTAGELRAQWLADEADASYGTDERCLLGFLRRITGST